MPHVRLLARTVAITVVAVVALALVPGAVSSATALPLRLADPASGCLTDDSQTAFQAGQATDCDLTTSPGSVRIARAAGVDQQNTAGTTTGTGFGTPAWTAQTFVPSVTGAVTSIEVEMFCSGCGANPPDLVVSVRATAGPSDSALPTGPDLAASTLPGSVFASGDAAEATATFATPANVDAGTAYAIVVRPVSAPAGNGYFWIRSSPSTYAAGSRVISADSGGTWTIDSTRDYNFKVTVDEGGYAPSATFTSSVKDAAPPAGATPTWTTLSFSATTPAGTSVAFQVAGSSSSSGPFVFVGPDGTSATSFTTSGADLSQFDGMRYLRYRAVLSTTDPAVTPTLSSVTLCFEAVEQPQAVAFTSTAPTPASIGTTYTAVATGGASGNDIVYSVDPSTTNAACTVSGSTVSFHHAGSCVVAADQAGNGSYAAGRATQAITVAKSAQVVTFTSTPPDPASVGGTYTLVADSAGSGPAVVFAISPSTSPGDTCSIAGAQVSFDHVGTCVVTVDRPGDADHTAAPTDSQTIAVGKAAQTITFSPAAPSSAAIGDTYTPAATATGGGTVTFSIDPATTGGACSLDAGTVSFHRAGTCVVAADQAGDADHLPGHTTVSVSVARTAQVVTFTSTAPAPAAIGGTYVPTATASGGGPVTFSIAPATTNGACSIDAGTVSFDHAGRCVVAADQAGDAQHESARATQTITVSRSAQTIRFTSTPPDPAHVNETYDVTTTGGPSANAVQLAADGSCRIDDDRVTFLRTGTCTVTATQDGDDDTEPAAEVSQEIEVVQSEPVMTATRTSAVRRTAHGWYRAPVTVTFRCDPDTSTIDGACPRPVTLKRSGRDLRVKRSFTTVDGATATATVTVDIDRVLPRAWATGIRRHHTYTSIPDIGCAARDTLSGIAKCRVRTRVTHDSTRLVYRLVAVDKAGNRRVVTGRLDLDLAGR